MRLWLEPWQGKRRGDEHRRGSLPKGFRTTLERKNRHLKVSQENSGVWFPQTKPKKMRFESSPEPPFACKCFTKPPCSGTLRTPSWKVRKPHPSFSIWIHLPFRHTWLCIPLPCVLASSETTFELGPAAAELEETSVSRLGS